MADKDCNLFKRNRIPAIMRAMQSSIFDQNTNIYTVSRLNNEVRALIEDAYPFVWVEGEISNFTAANSGHWYFCLKDHLAQARCAMFRIQARRLNFVPKDGMQVLIKARVSLYEHRGEFQLIVEFIEERGEGKLRQAFELLKKKLELAGFFEQSSKKVIPAFPKQIGIITSPTGAAIRDILIVMKRRFPNLPIVIYPTLVQGETASSMIVNAIQNANRRNECDVLIIARGGGSLEDLWSFNTEPVAKAIYASQIPIVSGVGHEVDFTIADFVADLRAATPSAAAELVTPHTDELMKSILQYKTQICRYVSHKLTLLSDRLSFIQKHLSQQHPKQRLVEKMQRLDFYELTLKQQQSRLLAVLHNHLKSLEIKLHKSVPIDSLYKSKDQLQHFYHQLTKNIGKQLQHAQSELSNSAVKLDALSPLATLKRGFAIAETKEGKILYQSTQTRLGSSIRVRLGEGSLHCLVEKID